jgi:hypothetical protein
MIAEVFRQAMARGELSADDPGIATPYFVALINAENQCRWFLNDSPP